MQGYGATASIGDNQTVTSYAWSAGYPNLEIALLHRRIAFKKLTAEIKDFKPLSAQEFDAANPDFRDRVRASYPDISDENLQKHVDFQVEPNTQQLLKFGEAHKSEYIQIIILSHAFCEGLINAIIAMGLAKNQLESLFDVIDRATFLDKWTVCPKSFFPAYDFPKQHHLYALLTRLNTMRNSLMHGKIDLNDGQGRQLIKGTKSDFLPFPQDTKWANHFLELPYELLAFTYKQMPQITFPIYGQSGVILRTYKEKFDL